MYGYYEDAKRKDAIELAIDFLREDGTVAVEEVLGVAELFYKFMKGTSEHTPNLSPDVLARITNRPAELAPSLHQPGMYYVK